MNIIDAIKSGKKFKQKESNEWINLENPNQRWFRPSQLIAEDWEIEEEKIEITKERFGKVMAKYAAGIAVPHGIIHFTTDIIWEKLVSEGPY